MERQVLPTGHHKQMDNQLQSQDTGNHAEAATWSGHTGPWTCTDWHCPVTPSSPNHPLFIPPTLFLGKCTQQTVFSPVVLKGLG